MYLTAAHEAFALMSHHIVQLSRIQNHHTYQALGPKYLQDVQYVGGQTVKQDCYLEWRLADRIFAD